MNLTNEQRRELANGEPVRLTDPDSDQDFVVLRADVYDELRAIADGYARRAGWDDPALDVYEQYRKPEARMNRGDVVLVDWARSRTPRRAGIAERSAPRERIAEFSSNATANPVA